MSERVQQPRRAGMEHHPQPAQHCQFQQPSLASIYDPPRAVFRCANSLDESRFATYTKMVDIKTTSLPIEDYRQALNYAEADLKDHWQDYRAHFLKELEHGN